MSKVKITATTPEGKPLGSWETHDDGRHVDGNELRAANAVERRILGPEWLTFADAARALGVERKNLATNLRVFLTHKSASLRDRGARNVGYVYRRADIECVKAIRKCLGCSARHACETLYAFRVLRRNGLLDEIEKQLDLLPTEENSR